MDIPKDKVFSQCLEEHICFNLSFWKNYEEMQLFPTVFVSLYALVMILNEYKTFLHPFSLIVFGFQSVLIKAFSPSM